MRRQGSHAADSQHDPQPSSTSLSIPPSSATSTSDEDEEDLKKYHNNNTSPIPNPLSSTSPPLYRLTIFLVVITSSALCYWSTLEGGDTEQWLHARLYGMAMWMVISDVLFTLAIMTALSLDGARWRRVSKNKVTHNHNHDNLTIIFITLNQGAVVYAITNILCMFALDQGNTVQHHGAYVFSLL